MEEHRSQLATIQEEFKAQLRTEWTRKVACERECDPDAECVCQRHFIHTEKLESWMNRQDSEDLPNTKASRLLAELHDKIKNHRVFGLPLDSAPIFTGENRSLIMFSMLLDQDRGDLIDIFHNVKMCDKYLDASEELYKAFRPALQKKLQEIGRSDSEVNEIIETVGRERWAYCSPVGQFTLHMDTNFEGGKAVMPFCRRMRVNNKGGTASVFWVAVQEDLIKDQKLRAALGKSLYPDPEFGPCYQMALKSYREEMKTFFDGEKEAFSGLKYDPDTHIVRYLGSYSHNNGDKTDGKTYNLLLEFGEKDLEEYCADLTNVPPVRASEIIRFWESLFEVATAVEKIHNLSIKQGSRTSHYNGWHADIKPDNILRVHGKFKLADFGFSRFAEKVGPALAKSYIEGGTDTYGAPEFARMKASGTRSEVTQTIDTWSFGCVLSVAATWVVLGYQGVLQYRKLRERSSGTLAPNGKPTDRFHDGQQVLPEIKRWHQFLRGHTRNADTATSLVLGHIEVHMLQKDARDRLQFKDLCKELKDLIKTAQAMVENLPSASKDTDDSVKHALYAMEKEAENRTSDVNATPLKRESRLEERTALLSVANANPSVRVSSRNNKSDILRDFPRAQIPYRKEILEKELDVKSVLEQSIHESPGGLHDGAHTSSPIDNNPSKGPSVLKGLGIETIHGSSTHYQHVNVPVPTIREPITKRETSPRHQPPAVPPISKELLSDHQNQYLKRPRSPQASFQQNNLAAREEKFSSEPRAGPPLTPPLPVTGLPQRTTASGSANPCSVTNPREHSAKRAQSDGFAERNGDLPEFLGYGNSRASASELESPPKVKYPLKSPPSPRPFSINGIHAQNQPPASKVSVEGEPQSSTDTPTFSSGPDRHGKEKQTVFDSPSQQELSSSHAAKKSTTVPASVYHLPWDICKVRLDSNAPAGPKSILGKLGSKAKGIFGMETQERDQHLAEVIHDRELIFVIDNAASMLEHWPILTFVAETLCMKVAGLDKSGVDLKFTVLGHLRNKKNLRGSSGRAQFRKSINEAKPEISTEEERHARTDMQTVLREIFQEWRKDERPKTTLLIFTDGEWESTIPYDAADNEIVSFAKEVQETKSFAPRHFSIGLVRFGENNKTRLQYLDDELCKKHKDRNGEDLADIIDHCSWRSTVYKMLVGSLDPYQDKSDPNENMIDYDYKSLNNLFDLFNRGVIPPVVLQVPQAPPAEASRLSSRGSWQRPHNIQRHETDPRSVISPTRKPKRFSLIN